MKLNDYLEIKTALLQELRGTLQEERRKVIFEELASINRNIAEKGNMQKTCYKMSKLL